MRTVALLLDDETNLYQQLLVREAQAVAPKHGLQLLRPEYAGGSSWTQAESVNQHLRAERRPDAMMVVLAGSQAVKPLYERVAKAGIPLALLNRVPDWVRELRSALPQAFVTGVMPDQALIGQLQGQQALRLAPAGAFLILITGTAASVAAAERKRGFLETVGGQFVVHELDGGWSASGAEEASSAWFRLGADRDRVPRLVVCQNDAMAAGARVALRRHAEVSGSAEFGRVPLVGCDGLPDEGRASVDRGELAATVVMPVTTPPALAALGCYFESGARADVQRLEASSYPPLESLRPA